MTIHRQLLRDYVSRRDWLNPKRTTPREDRISDTWAWIWRASVAIGLWIIVLNQFFNLLAGD